MLLLKRNATEYLGPKFATKKDFLVDSDKNETCCASRFEHTTRALGLDNEHALSAPHFQALRTFIFKRTPYEHENDVNVKDRWIQFERKRNMKAATIESAMALPFEDEKNTAVHPVVNGVRHPDIDEVIPSLKLESKKPTSDHVKTLRDEIDASLLSQALSSVHAGKNKMLSGDNAVMSEFTHAMDLIDNFTTNSYGGPEKRRSGKMMDVASLSRQEIKCETIENDAKRSKRVRQDLSVQAVHAAFRAMDEANRGALSVEEAVNLACALLTSESTSDDELRREIKRDWRGKLESRSEVSIDEFVEAYYGT